MNFKGLNNMGNTCYLNAGLQLILHNKNLCNLIINNSHNNPILYEISKFINEYHTSSHNSISPIFIKKYIASINDIFNGSNQQDSSEFIIYFLDAMNDELKKNNESLDKLYSHTLNISIKCKLRVCLNVSSHDEKNNIMIFDLKDDFVELDDCYYDYKKRIKLENESLYNCEKCNKKTIASKRTEITHYPNHLIIILSRFNKNGNRLLKNNKELYIPIHWKHHYKLKGFVYHSGSLYSGHYVYIGEYNNIWHLFDDDTVSPINENYLEKLKNNSYIYYYEKII